MSADGDATGAVAKGGGPRRPDFGLPDEVLAIIPSDPYDQLDLARKITSIAISSRVSILESEVDLMREKINEKDRLMQELEQKVLRLQKALQDSEYRLKISLDDNVLFLLTFCSFPFLSIY